MVKLFWDSGTAYDLFVSLTVLHHPTTYGAPGSWAAGMRARLPAASRQTLEQAQFICGVPLTFIYNLPAPKDSATVLWTLRQISPGERLAHLALDPDGPPPPVPDMLRAIAARGSYTEKEREAVDSVYRELYSAKKEPHLNSKQMKNMLDGWAHAAEFGERYLEALTSYVEVFFAEEEIRIRPALDAALARARQLASKLELPDLLEELSQGLRLTEPIKMTELVLAPSYWSTPLVFFGQAGPKRDLWLFGARPADASLVPGEAVPETMIRALKALSDPTRLRILQYLAQEPLTPAQLARRLRLRAPTVLHHLQTLRLAGLVQLTVGEEQKRYAARPEAVAGAFSAVQSFVQRREAAPAPRSAAKGKRA